MSAGPRWHNALTAQAWRRILFVVLCCAPLATGIASRFQRHSHWFADYDAIACAGAQQAQGRDFYVWPAPCPEGMLSSGYVYTPAVARTFEWGADALGRDGFKAAYLFVSALSLGFLVWLVFLRRDAPGGFWDRAPAFGLVTGSLVYSANIALLLHAVICAAALVAPRRPWLFVLALAAAAAVKPVYLVYGLVLLVLHAPWPKRLAMGATVAVLGLMPTLVFAATGGELAAGWRANIDVFVYGRQPGDGFYGWLSALGLDGRGLAPALVCAAYVGLIAAAAIAIAACARLNGQGRVSLGLGLAALANPRLSPNDILPLALALGSVIAVARSAGLPDRVRRGVVALAAGGAVIGALGNSLDAGDYCVKIFTLMLFAAVIWLATELARKDRRALIDDFAAPQPS